LTPLQVSPLPQLRPEQHGWPSPPQVWQVSPPLPAVGAQVVPAVVHRLFEQHACPVLPHATQAVPLHTTLPAVQRLLVQQGSPAAPQRVTASGLPPSTALDTQAPAEQVRLAALPELAQASPTPTQVAAVVEVQQQPPALQRLAEQQSWPAPPQTRQVPALVPDSTQSAPVAVQVLPSQQAAPTAPQVWQVSGPVVAAWQEVPVALHLRLAQHGWPAPPHSTQFPPEHTLVADVQVSRAQQAWPTAPQAVHRPALQVAPLPHAFPSQHGCPTPPQVSQRRLLHTSPPAVQTLPVQQAWLAAPQSPHEPAVHVPPRVGQVEPAAVHRLSTQQPPVPQAPPEQQDWPAPPQGVHVPLLLHTRLAVPQVRFAQQVSPLPPQVRQRPLLQIAPVPVQVSPAQHASPNAPQVGAGASGTPSGRASDRASGVPPSSRVPVLVVVVVVVLVVVLVAVVVVVVVLVAVDVDAASPAGTSRTTSPPDGTSRA